MKRNWVIPQWPVNPRVRCLSTTRIGGVSLAPYDSLNLGDHVGDREEAVARNREILTREAGLEDQPVWLKQVHGTVVVDAARCQGDVEADASFTTQSGVACVVMTADCLPVLFADDAGSVVAAAHAGWRGLVDGVLEATMDALPVTAAKLSAWLGPAIGPLAFEVGGEVREQFMQHDMQSDLAFKPFGQDKWLADIYMLARQRLLARGLDRIYGGGLCTYTDKALFYSYRRDGRTGRMASVIYLQD